MKRKRLTYETLCLMVCVLCLSCADDSMVSLGIDDSYRIERMRKLRLTPALTGAEYRWTVDGETVSCGKDYVFIAATPGVYHLAFDIIDANSPFHHEFDVTVMEEEVAYSPFISEVVEYCPAPGQFINLMPEYAEGDTYADMLKKCTESVMGTNDVMISLGGYGGYVTFKFDHTVMNVPGEKDFRVWGNCFYELTDTERKGGSAEPGIVMVSFDANCNGLLDDPWYELKGSDYDNPLTRHNYTIAYVATQEADIPWVDSEGEVGSIEKNMYHDQPYWPGWVDEDTLSFTGTRLPNNAVDTSGAGTYYILYSFDWGYVDNHPNEEVELNSFDIGNAVDAEGHPVSLPGADFIRVYTGVNQQCGWLGETSTELSRAMDLHISSQ